MVVRGGGQSRGRNATHGRPLRTGRVRNRLMMVGLVAFLVLDILLVYRAVRHTDQRPPAPSAGHRTVTVAVVTRPSPRSWDMSATAGAVSLSLAADGTLLRATRGSRYYAARPGGCMSPLGSSRPELDTSGVTSRRCCGAHVGNAGACAWSAPGGCSVAGWSTTDGKGSRCRDHMSQPFRSASSTNASSRASSASPRRDRRWPAFPLAARGA